MKRPAAVVLGMLVAGAVVFGVLKGLPQLRDTIETYRHVQQAALHEPGAEHDWRREFGDPAKTLATFPRREDSAAAVRLVELAHSVGIEMARPKSERPDSLEPNGERAERQAVGDYVNAELARQGGGVGAPPHSVQGHLEAHGRGLAAIVDFLATSEPPVWKSDPQLGAEAPVPNLLGHIRLQRLLTARALGEASVGQEHEAERILQASWTLNKSLRDRPEVISQLIAIAAARMQVGLARRLPVDPALWRSRFADHDYRTSLLQGLEVEAIAHVHYLPTGSSAWDRASRADFLDMQRAFLVGLRDSPVSDRPLRNFGQPYLDENPRSAGAIVATIALPNLANALRRVDRLIIDIELTDRILQARMLKASLGHWPTEILGVDASRMADARWIYAVDADGRLTISFSKELHWEGQNGLMLPLRYEST